MIHQEKFNHGLNNLWKVWQCRIKFFKYFTKTRKNTILNFLEIFLQMYLTQFIINRLIKKSARNVIIGFFVVVGITTAIICWY